MGTARIPVWRFYATYNSVITEVFPVNIREIKYSYTQDKGTSFYQKKMSGKLKFQDIPHKGITDYTYFKAIEDSDPCSVVTIEVKKYCRGSGYTTWWRGEFGTVDGSWDNHRCVFEVEPLSVEEFDCLMGEVEFNVLEIPTVVSTFYDGGSNADRTYARCRLFSDMLEFLATETCPAITGIVSDFFEINPAGTAPGYVSGFNYVTGMVNRYTEMTVSQKSDVREPIPSNAATEALTTFKRVMDDLAIMFNVFWTIEGTTVRIEHKEYFEGQAGIDLTQSQYDKFTVGTEIYSYDRPESPRYETWLSEDQGQVRITYDNACGNSRPGETEQKKQVREFYLDLIELRLNGSEITNLNGLVLFATEFNAGTGQYDVLGSVNDEIDLAKFIQQFHRHDRPQLNGEFAGEDFFIISAKKLKKQEPLFFPLCCDPFDPADYITTSMGQGRVDQASYDTGTGWLTVNLAYGPEPVADLTSLSGLASGILTALYLSDSGVTQSGGFVSQWNDMSGNGYHASQATSAFRPQIVNNVQNGFPAIRPDGVDDFLLTSAFQAFPLKRGSVFVVSKDRYIDPVVVMDSGFNTPGDWTTGGARWVVGASKATYNSTLIGGNILTYSGSVSPSIVLNAFYQVEFEILAAGGASVSVAIGSGTTATVSAVGSYVFIFQASGGTTITITGSGAGTIEVDSLNIYPVYTGSHPIIGTYGTGVGNLWDIRTQYGGSEPITRLYDSDTYGALSLDEIGTSYRYIDDFILYNGVRDSDTVFKSYTNGRTTGINQTIANVQPSSNPMYMFTDGLGNYMRGDVIAIAIFNRDLTPVERQRVEWYFMKRYALNVYT